MRGTTLTRLWVLGGAIRPPLMAIAAVEVPVASVLKLKLQCVPDAMPDYDEHGVIIGWDREDKSKRLALQLELVAARSTVHRAPTNDRASN